jgi:hypothetical protein
MGRRSALGAGVLIAAAITGWRMWPHDPGPVAPPLTASEVRQFDRVQQGDITGLGGGSKSHAHELWAYYHDRPAYQGVKPRLLGISRVRLRDSPADDGIYWLVFSDHVYQASFGPGRGGFGREVVLVPDRGSSVTGNITTF